MAVLRRPPKIPPCPFRPDELNRSELIRRQNRHQLRRQRSYLRRGLNSSLVSAKDFILVLFSTAEGPGHDDGWKLLEKLNQVEALELSSGDFPFL